MAAKIQSLIGIVAPGSIFSYLQSIAAIKVGMYLWIIGGVVVIAGVTYMVVKKYQDN